MSNLNLASVGKRVGGSLIDLVVCGIIFVPYTFFWGNTQFGNFFVNGISAIPLLGIWFLYFIVSEALWGKTVGKLFLKLRVVNESGQEISFWQSVGRNLFRIIDGSFFYLVGFIILYASKNKQRLGDIVVKTFVIQE